MAIDVSGIQSGVWSPDNNPYNVVGDITIPAGETLEIQAGVEVIAMGDYRITALGNILSIGTQNDSIRFHGNNGLNWGGLRLEDETNESHFYYCRISNTDDMNNYPIQSINSPIFINHSFFDDHQSGISFFALSSNDPSYMEIKNSKITNVQKSGITITDNSNALIDSCEIVQCGLGTQFYGAIRLLLMDNSHSCSPTITNNYIHHNSKQGITMANIFNYNEMAPTVEYNEISYNHTGVYLYNAKGYYKNNLISNNFEEGNADSGAGVMLYGSGANGTFTYNHIYGNYTGFYITTDATANIGDLNNANTDDDGFNMIHNNVFYTGETYSIYNESAMNVIAENNMWDSNDPDEIGETIIDGNDNPAYGIVDFNPYLTIPLLPPTNVVLNPYLCIIFWEPPELLYTYATLIGYNIYLDGVPVAIVGIDVFEYQYEGLVPGQQYIAGVSALYEEGESGIVEGLWAPHICNPPTNASYEIFEDHIHLTWQEPEPGSTHPFLNYRIYVDGELDGETTELFYDIYDLISGQTYFVGLTAFYEYLFESDPIEFEITFNEVNPESIIPLTYLYPNYPNPFNPETTISYQLPADSKVNLSIYNIKGQKVKTLVNEVLPSGEHSAIWNGRDSNGNQVSSGIYFYKLEAGDFQKVKKMVLVK